jgi:hypothetical protein
MSVVSVYLLFSSRSGFRIINMRNIPYNVGKLLRALATTFARKRVEGTRLIAEPNGNNVKDWTIRG